MIVKKKQAPIDSANSVSQSRSSRVSKRGMILEMAYLCRDCQKNAEGFYKYCISVAIVTKLQAPIDSANSVSRSRSLKVSERGMILEMAYLCRDRQKINKG